MEKTSKQLERQTSVRVARKQAATKKAIIEAALGLFEAESYRSVTIAQIMEKADYAVGTYYNFFTNKEDLIITAAKDLMAESNSFLMDIPKNIPTRERIEYMMNGAANVIAANQTLFDLYISIGLLGSGRTDGPELKHASGSLAFTANLVREGQEKGEFRSDVSPEIIAELIQSTLQSSYRRKGKDFVEAVKTKTLFILDAIALT